MANAKKQDWVDVNESLLEQLKTLKKLCKRLKKDPRAPTPKENYRLAKSIQKCTTAVQKLVERQIAPTAMPQARRKKEKAPPLG